MPIPGWWAAGRHASASAMQEQEPVRTVEPWRRLWRDWLAPYRWMWESHLDRLGVHLDTMSDDEGDSDVR